MNKIYILYEKTKDKETSDYLINIYTNKESAIFDAEILNESDNKNFYIKPITPMDTAVFYNSVHYEDVLKMINILNNHDEDLAYKFNKIIDYLKENDYFEDEIPIPNNNKINESIDQLIHDLFFHKFNI